MLGAKRSQDVTQLIRAWGSGDKIASDLLFPVVYADLRRIAQNQSGGGKAHATLAPTALVNEAFLEFSKNLKPDWRDRSQFFAFAATVMRRLMVDYWRERHAGKRGGNADPVLFDELVHTPSGEPLNVESLDQALNRLAELDETQARIVELRFFGGMSVDETAAYLGISSRTVHREWGMAKAWLAAQLTH